MKQAEFGLKVLKFDRVSGPKTLEPSTSKDCSNTVWLARFIGDLYPVLKHVHFSFQWYPF